MRTKRFFKISSLLLLLLVMAAAKCSVGFNSSSQSEKTITVNLAETQEAFKNPIKGFRPTRYIGDSGFKDYEYSSLYKQYIKYTDLEYNASDTVQKIKDWSNKAWDGLEKKNLKVIPRVVIKYPSGPAGGEYWPDGIPHGNDIATEWTSDTLRDRLIGLALKLGEAWDNDPRVAAVELGLWGKWGEHHIYPATISSGSTNGHIPAWFQQALGDTFTTAFKNKKVMVRYPETFSGYDFGYYWDSFALPDDARSGTGEIENDRWKTQMNSGEVAYDWGDQSKLGGSPNGTLSSDSKTDYVINWIQRTHTSSLGWIAEYKTSGSNSDAIKVNSTRIQKALGYRFVIDQVTFSSRSSQGGAVYVSFKVSNVGNAPFYYIWPVEISLLQCDRSPVWKDTFHTNITQWLPGESYNISEVFILPKNLACGTYTLALAVLDPAGNQPSLRFANTNYYRGGRTPVGKIGIGQNPIDQKLGNFDSLKLDDTLSYSMSPAD